MQRFFDIFFSGIALLFLAPIFLPIIFLLRITGEGEVFFFQERIGWHGRKFRLFKFATMLKNSPNMSTGTVTIKSDPRILPFGKFLRKTKINELPQLINIFLGDMSIVGPRPLTTETFEIYTAEIQELIIKVKPGLSGIGSIIFRDEENILIGADSSLDFYKKNVAPYKGILEVWYASNNTIFNYFKIIVVTVIIVLHPKSQIAWSSFKKLPTPPAQLKSLLNYPG
ncbi:sugar transferase [Polynucleobacter sp. HIN7]|uniref:sugar transferase n=1 Tax=Polynucleobacter sp. HIN7 TaxID=3047866 RepID=UPI0025734C1D|nr:sugar transferase [Polynucleobacter sp. HIN7]